MDTIPNTNEEFRRLDEVINNKLIESLTDKKLCVNDERLLLSQPTKLIEIGITVFSEISDIEFQNPLLPTVEHTSLIARQELISTWLTTPPIEDE